MIDVKISFTVALQGGVMVPEEDTVREIVKVVNGRKRKQIVPNHNNLESISLKLQDGSTLNFTVRKSIPAKQAINLSSAAYTYFVSEEIPEGFRSSKKGSWLSLSKKERLTWHLNRIAESLNGTLIDYHVIE